MSLTASVQNFLVRLMVILINMLFFILCNEMCYNLKTVGKEILILKSLRTAGLVANSMDSGAILCGFKSQRCHLSVWSQGSASPLCPSFLVYKNGANAGTYLREVLWALKWVDICKYLWTLKWVNVCQSLRVMPDIVSAQWVVITDLGEWWLESSM